MMSRAVLPDTNAFEDEEIIFVLCELGFFHKVVMLKSVVHEFIDFRTHPDPKKRELSQRAVYTLVELQSRPGLRVIMDNQDPTDPHPDFDLLNRAKTMKGCILTADSELHEKAEAKGIATLFLLDLRCRLRLVTPALIKLFPPLRDIIPGEILNVHVVKPGRADDQGIAYLEDRRKVVINGGSPYIGQEIAVRVENTYQPAPGYEVVFAVPTVIAAVA
jgi:uncharacterized protein YacL